MKPAPSLALLALVTCACGPQPVELRARFSFGAQDERAAIAAAVPPGLLQQLGGALPDPYPPGAPRLLLDATMQKRVGVNLKVLPFKPSVVRLQGLRARIVGSLDPLPAQLEVRARLPGHDQSDDDTTQLLGRTAWLPDGTLRELVLEPGAPALLAQLVTANFLHLLVDARVPVDTRRDLRAPLGSAIADVELAFDLVP